MRLNYLSLSLTLGLNPIELQFHFLDLTSEFSLIIAIFVGSRSERYIFKGLILFHKQFVQLGFQLLNFCSLNTYNLLEIGLFLLKPLNFFHQIFLIFDVELNLIMKLIFFSQYIIKIKMSFQILLCNSVGVVHGGSYWLD